GLPTTPSWRKWPRNGCRSSFGACCPRSRPIRTSWRGSSERSCGPGKILAAKKRAARMIAKHVPMKATAKSDFGGLVRYITSAQGRDERVGVVTVTNCQGETPEDAAQDVMLVQSANQRAASDKTYHLIISFRPGENPSAEVMRDIEEAVCAA